MSLADITEKAIRERGYLLASEAARKIDKDVRTVYRWLDAKKVRGFKEGGHRRYVKWKDILSHMGPVRCAILKVDDKDIWVESGTQVNIAR